MGSLLGNRALSNPWGVGVWRKKWKNNIFQYSNVLVDWNSGVTLPPSQPSKNSEKTMKKNRCFSSTLSPRMVQLLQTYQNGHRRKSHRLICNWFEGGRWQGLEVVGLLGVWDFGMTWTIFSFSSFLARQHSRHLNFSHKHATKAFDMSYDRP
jgi:hypothetical protein